MEDFVENLVGCLVGYVFGLNRDTGELTEVEKTPVPGSEKTSLVSLPMTLAPNKRFIYAQLRSEPYLVSTFSIDHINGKLTHLGATPLVDQIAYINVDKTGQASAQLYRCKGGRLPDRRPLCRRRQRDPDHRHQAKGALRLR